MLHFKWNPLDLSRGDPREALRSHAALSSWQIAQPLFLFAGRSRHIQAVRAAAPAGGRHWGGDADYQVV